MIRFWLQRAGSALKVRATYWWLIIKYGGRKNIPRELVLGKVKENFDDLEKNLMLALREIPEDIPEKDRKEFLELIGKLKTMQKEIQ